eukprot:1148734-Pelagomonas_calceolata.AAC.4
MPTFAMCILNPGMHHCDSSFHSWPMHAQGERVCEEVVDGSTKRSCSVEGVCLDDALPEFDPGGCEVYAINAAGEMPFCTYSVLALPWRLHPRCSSSRVLQDSPLWETEERTNPSLSLLGSMQIKVPVNGKYERCAIDSTLSPCDRGVKAEDTVEGNILSAVMFSCSFKPVGRTEVRCSVCCFCSRASKLQCDSSETEKAAEVCDVVACLCEMKKCETRKIHCCADGGFLTLEPPCLPNFGCLP